MGASYSTNEAILMAKGYWVRLLDGDDIIAYKSTAKMLRLAKQKKEEFVYGLIHEPSQTERKDKIKNYITSYFFIDHMLIVKTYDSN